VFVGAPVAVAWLLQTAGAAAASLRGHARAVDRVRLAVATGLALLVLSGQARGEVGRIWIPLMPFLLLTALAASEDESPDRPGAGEAALIAVLAAASTVAMRIAWHVP
jgi:hypothetical protein